MHEEIVKIHQSIAKRKAVFFNWETIRYKNVVVDGDIEIEDVCTQTVINMSVPVISFIELIDLIRYCRTMGYKTSHYYTNEIVPFEDEGTKTWFYFDNQYEHTLFHVLNKHDILAIYYLKDFEKYIVIRIKNQ